MNWLKRILKRFLNFIKKSLYDKRRKILSAFIGLLLVVLVRFGRVGKQVVKNSDVITKEVVQQVDELPAAAEVFISTVDNFSKINPIVNPKNKDNTKSQKIATLLRECYKYSKFKNDSIRVDSCYNAVYGYFKKIEDSESLRKLERGFYKYYLKDLSIIEKTGRLLINTENDNKFDSIWKSNVVKLNYQEESLLDTLYIRFKKQKTLVRRRDSLLKVNEENKID